MSAPPDPASVDQRPGPAQRIATLADQCVKCGLCLPHCPTYRLAGLEGESPRGRIALLQGLHSGRLSLSDTTARHLDNCLGCRSCEAVCPARVPYGELIDAGRHYLPASGPSALRWLSRHPRMARLAMNALALCRRLNLHRLGPRSETAPPTWFWRSLRRLPLPAPSARLRGLYEPEKPARGEVLLFTGCVGRSMDRATLVAAARVIAYLGYRVRIPSDQGCCGALDQHDGLDAQTGRCIARNHRAFGDGDEPIVTTASGCAATLLDYGRLAATEGAGIQGRTRDVCAFVLDHIDELAESLDHQSLRVALHQPCTARNVTRSAAAAAALMQRLPGIESHDLDAGHGCCGAAGHHFLSRPAQADAMLEPLIEAIDRLKPDIVATTNIGCALHLGGELDARAAAPKVIHPIVLVARGLGLTD